MPCPLSCVSSKYEEYHEQRGIMKFLSLESHLISFLYWYSALSDANAVDHSKVVPQSL